MNPQQSLKGVTRRTIPLFYISPAECMLAAVFSGSGSGSSESATIDLAPVTRSAGPTSLTAHFISETGVKLNWAPVTGAFSYVIYRASAAAGPFTLVASNVGHTEFIDTTGVLGFFYKVTALEPNFGETFPSPVVQAT